MVHDNNSQVLDKVETRPRLDRPRFYKVIMHDDDHTTMDFVVAILAVIFDKSLPEAVELMLEVHKHGSAICGVFTREIAEIKIALVYHNARRNGFPLRCTMEPE